MGLPACEERILHRMEIVLRSHEPRLATMFGVFTQLTRDEEIPGIERLRRSPWLSWRRLRRATVMLVIWCLVVSACVGVGLFSPHPCGQPPAHVAAAQIRGLAPAARWAWALASRCHQGR
jgi:hypothetical protein